MPHSGECGRILLAGVILEHLMRYNQTRFLIPALIAHFIHTVFLCEPVGGKLGTGSDALNAKWFNPNALDKVQSDLRRILEATGFIRD